MDLQDLVHSTNIKKARVGCLVLDLFSSSEGRTSSFGTEQILGPERARPRAMSCSTIEHRQRRSACRCFVCFVNHENGMILPEACIRGESECSPFKQGIRQFKD